MRVRVFRRWHPSQDRKRFGWPWVIQFTEGERHRAPTYARAVAILDGVARATAIGPWINGYNPADGSIHVLPVDDLIPHTDDECDCGPTVEPVPRDDGSMGWLITHHSLDGREANE